MRKGVIAVIAAVAIAIPINLVAFGKYNNHDFREAPATIGNCKDPAVSAMVYSIKEYPNRWSADDYRMTHSSGANIWIANEDYGLSISADGEASPDGYVMSDQCRELLYSSIINWQHINVNEKIRS